MSLFLRFGLICIGLMGWIVPNLRAQSGRSLVQDARELAGVLDRLDSLQTVLMLEGASDSYLWNGLPDTTSRDTLVLRRPGRYTFSAHNGQAMTLTLVYGTERISLKTLGTAYILHSPERSDMYSDHPEALPAKNQVLDHFPDALYVLTDYVDARSGPGSLGRMLRNPFLADQLGAWLPGESVLHERLRARILQERKNKVTPAPPQSVAAQLGRDPIYASTVPTAPERLQKASEALYASQGGILAGAIDQTALIQGLATFIEKRAQEELNMLFLERMQQKLEQSRFGLLFPQTLALFTQFEIDQYRTLLDHAYPFFQQDLQDIGLNFPRLLRQDSSLQHLAFNPNVLNAAHFLELTNLALTGNEIDTIFQRAYHIYEEEEKVMRDLWRGTFSSQLRLPEFQKAYITPIGDIVRGWTDQEQALYRVLDTLVQFTSSGNVPPVNGETTPWEMLRQRLEESEAHLRNEQYFLQRDRSPVWDRFLVLADLVTQSDPQKLFAQARLSDYATYIERMQGDSVLASELVLMAEQVLKKDLAFYQQEALASAKMEEIAIREILLEAEILRQQGLLERGLRLLQIDYYLREALTAELSFWRKSGQEVRSQDTMALHFFQAVLGEPGQRNRIDNLAKEFLETTLPLSFLPDLSERFARTESFQDSLIHLLAPHMSRLQLEGEPVAHARSFVAREAAWKALMENQRKKNERIDEGEGPEAIEELKNDIANQYHHLQSGRLLATTTGGITPDDHNPFWAKAQALQGIPPIKLPPELLRQRDHLGKIADQMALLKEDMKTLGEQLDQELNEKADFSFLRASENARNLRSIAELSLVLTQAFRYHDTVMVVEERALRRGSTTTAIEPSPGGERTTVTLRDTFITRKERVPTVREWLTPQQLDTIMNDPAQRSAFLGLLYHRISGIEDLFIEPSTVGTLAVQAVELIDATRRARLRAQARRDSTEETNLGDFLPVARGVLRLFSTVLDVPSGTTTLADRLHLSGVNRILDQSLGTYEYLVQEDYGQALTATMGLYQTFAQDEREEKSGRVEAYQLQQTILRYGHFAADMVQAGTADEVQSILTRYSSPVGSSRQKRANALNVSLNAYLGPSLAYERGLGDVPETAESMVVALSTPVGLAFSWRTAKTRKEDITFRSWTAFASILDIGPVISYNFDQGAVSETPDLSFSDFIAPGLFLFYNVPRTPFSGGLGYQQTAAIRSVDLDGLETRAYRTGRVTLFLGIDVPLFSFFTKP